MTTKATIVDDDTWTIYRWHGRKTEPDVEPFRRWCVTDKGILVQGEPTVRRTKGEPTTIGRIVNDYGATIDAWCQLFGVRRQTVAAMIGIESMGHPDAERTEPHLNDRSIGLTQTLTATARDIYRRVLQPGGRALFPGELGTLTPEPQGGDPEAWRPILSDPNTSIGLGTAALRYQNDHLGLRTDPVLLYLSWNAGGVYEKDDDPWGLRNYDPDGRGPKPGALDGFSKWYGDACAVYGVCE